jgi:hypothetical protein
MKTVQQHPDGLIYVRVDAIAYGDTIENFEADYGAPFPPLPEGASERIYDQGKRHTIMAEGNVIAGGEMPWPLGDTLITSVGALIAAKKTREQAAAAKAAEARNPPAQ